MISISFGRRIVLGCFRAFTANASDRDGFRHSGDTVAHCLDATDALSLVIDTVPIPFVPSLVWTPKYMTLNIRSAARRKALFVVSSLAVLALSACAPAPQASGINDPHEAANRRFHEVNRAVDRTILRPASKVYAILPQPVERGVENFADNLDTPGDVVNNLLQGRVGPAAQNSLRFATNTIFGIGGLFDTATALGLPGVETDFGETLHVWGVGEGAYIEVPFLGPSTTRDFAGTLVDLAANPVSLAVPQPESNISIVAKAASRLGDRARYSETVESVLYGSADSYAQLRLLYLQNRRFELGQTDGAASDGGNDGFVDPYEDPYVQ